MTRVVYVLLLAGVPFSCQEVPTEGPSGVPLARPLMTIARVYVNPATGVGPDPNTLAPFNTVLLTPRQDAAALPLLAAAAVQPTAAGSSDSSAVVTVAAFGEPPVVQLDTSADGDAAGLGLGSDSIWKGGRLPDRFLAIAARYKPQQTCPAGQPEDMQSAPTEDGTQMRIEDPCVKNFVGALSQCTPSGSPDVCCGFVAGWSQFNCWCMPAGQQLLDSIPTSMTPALLQLLGWVCD